VEWSREEGGYDRVNPKKWTSGRSDRPEVGTEDTIGLTLRNGPPEGPTARRSGPSLAFLWGGVGVQRDG
jgi:hypothetical protein